MYIRTGNSILNKIKCLSLLTLSLVLFACSGGHHNSKTDAYDFPVKPGTAEWRALTSHIDMLEACQIPNSILQTMSTAGLVETVLNYPLYIDMHAYNNLQIGFEAVSAQFNGIPELLHRDDAGTELLKTYCSIDVTKVSLKWEPLERGRFVMGTVDLVEVLLVQELIVSKMTTSERVSLLDEALKKEKEKSQKPQIYNYSGDPRIIARVLQHEEYPPFVILMDVDENIKQFLSDGSHGTPDFIDTIMSMAQEFLSQERNK